MTRDEAMDILMKHPLTVEETNNVLLVMIAHLFGYTEMDIIENMAIYSQQTQKRKLDLGWSKEGQA